MVGEDTFYESAEERDARFATLVREVAIDDVDWLARFIPWLRTVALMRSAPLVAACEAVHARLAAGIHGSNRELISGACARADEPGELLAYWLGKFGRALPMPVKRGTADATGRLYTEYSLLKYDTASHAVRFADVIELTHPAGKRHYDTSNALFAYALDRRHGHRDDCSPADTLRMIRANDALRAEAVDNPRVMLDADRLRDAGMTWEDALSLVGSKVDKKDLWSALIPSMGMMALMRNLRNFDEAGVNDDQVAPAITRFIDPEQVRRSRIFPYRWLTAYEQAPSLRWSHALDQALHASLSNIPSMSGRTLVLIDTSGSMMMSTSNHTYTTPVKLAAVFGVALALKGEDVDLVGFASGSFDHMIPRGSSLIREVDRFMRRVGEVGHGTDIARAVRDNYSGHDRVIIVSDMQTMSGNITVHVPTHIPMYGFNIGGYRPAPAPWGTTNRIELGGMTDATFRFIPLIEAGRNASWPF